MLGMSIPSLVAWLALSFAFGILSFNTKDNCLLTGLLLTGATILAMLLGALFWFILNRFILT